MRSLSQRCTGISLRVASSITPCQRPRSHTSSQSGRRPNRAGLADAAASRLTSRRVASASSTRKRRSAASFTCRVLRALCRVSSCCWLRTAPRPNQPSRISQAPLMPPPRSSSTVPRAMARRPEKRPQALATSTPAALAAADLPHQRLDDQAAVERQARQQVEQRQHHVEGAELGHHRAQPGGDVAGGMGGGQQRAPQHQAHRGAGRRHLQGADGGAALALHTGHPTQQEQGDAAHLHPFAQGHEGVAELMQQHRDEQQQGRDQAQTPEAGGSHGGTEANAVLLLEGTVATSRITNQLGWIRSGMPRMLISCQPSPTGFTHRFHPTAFFPIPAALRRFSPDPRKLFSSPLPMRPRTQLKICGLRDPAQAAAVAALGVEAIGVIAVPSSPRFVAEAQRPALFAAIEAVAPACAGVLVVADPSEQELAALVPARGHRWCSCTAARALSVRDLRAGAWAARSGRPCGSAPRPTWPRPRPMAAVWMRCCWMPGCRISWAARAIGFPWSGWRGGTAPCPGGWRAAWRPSGSPAYSPGSAHRSGCLQRR